MSEDEIPSALQRDWILLSIVAAASRFIPVPFLDGVVKTQANRMAVSRAWSHAGREVKVGLVSPLYETGSPLAFLLTLPLKLVLYPLRKIAKIVSAAHGVPTDLLETLLLGRAVHHALKAGSFTTTNESELKKEAKKTRKAFDKAFEGTNFKVLSSALGEALSHIKSLSSSAMSMTSELIKKVKSKDEANDEIGETDAVMDEGIHKVEGILQRSDVLAELTAFDTRFAEALSR